MNQPEWYRDDVSPAGGNAGTRTDVLRGQGESEPARRDPLRDAAVRESPPREAARESAGRVMGSPLPAGNSLGGSSALTEGLTHKTPPGRALPGASSASGDDPSSMQRAMGILKQAAPFVARLLPLLDGNFATALASVFAPRGHTPPPTVSVDLTPVHHQLSELQEQQNELRSAVQDQTTGMKRVEDQLEMVREATDRNTLEQQELIEDLKAMGSKVNLVAAGLSALLLLSVIMNLVLYLYVKKVLP
jgi:hypothetical protein